MFWLFLSFSFFLIVIIFAIFLMPGLGLTWGRQPPKPTDFSFPMITAAATIHFYISSFEDLRGSQPQIFPKTFKGFWGAASFIILLLLHQIHKKIPVHLDFLKVHIPTTFVRFEEGATPLRHNCMLK